MDAPGEQSETSPPVLPGPEENRRKAHAARVRVADVEFDAVTLPDAVGIVRQLAHDGRRHTVVTGNVDHIMLLRRDPAFRHAYELASLRVADGAPIVALSRLMGTPLPERVAGSDLLEPVLGMAEQEGLRVGFLGGHPGSYELAEPGFRAAFPALDLAGGYAPPYGFELDPAASQAAIDAVHAMRPDLLFVCLGAPKQEIWFASHLLELPQTVAIHVGAALDFAAGRVQRAPAVVRALGMEWLFRLVQEPRRLWRRYLVRDAAFVGVMGREVVRARSERRRTARRGADDRA